MEKILLYRQKIQEYIDDKTLKCIEYFEFYYGKDDNPHFSFSIIESSEKAHIENDKIKVKSMIAEFCPSEKHIFIDYDLSSGDFQPAMLSKQVDYSPTYDKPVDEKSADDNVNIAATLTFKSISNKISNKLGDKSISNPGSGSEGTCSRGLLIKLQRTSINLNALIREIPDLVITKEIYAIVGASHTAPRILKLNQTSLANSLLQTACFRPFVSGSDLIAHELNVAGQGFNVRKKFLHQYNDLEIFIIRNNNFNNNNNNIEEFNSFDCSFTHWNKEREKQLKGNIAHVWSGDVNNKVLEIGDEVYFIGQYSKSYGTVTAFPSKGVGYKEHSMIKCKLKVQKGDAGGVLFKPIQQVDTNNKVEYIAVGICSYFLPSTGENYGVDSYFIPLTDLDQSIYELPLPYCPFPKDRQTEKPIKFQETVFDFQRILLDRINDKTLKCIKSFEFYYDKMKKPHVSFSIIDPPEADLQVDKDEVERLIRNEFGFEVDPVDIDYELSSDDFYPAAMDTEQVDNENDVNVAASILANLGNLSTCYSGPGYLGTCTRGLIIKLIPNNLKGLEKIIPGLDITKEIYANVGASHTAPRIMNLSPNKFFAGTAHELNVSSDHHRVYIRNRSIHLYNDLDIFVIRNKMKSGSLKQFEELNTFKETFTDLDGIKETLEGSITHVWSGYVNNKVLKEDDTVYFLGQHNKSKGKVKNIPMKLVGKVNHSMIKCQLKVQKGDSGGVLFKPIPKSGDNNNKVKYIAVGICSHFNKIDGFSFFVPLTDLDESIYELPESIDKLPESID